MKEYNITINEKERKVLIYLMEKHLSICDRLVKSRGSEQDKKEKELRESILKSLQKEW